MEPIKYKERILKNGLKVVVHEDHSIPKMVLNVLYKVGAKDENPERTGFAHLFEHLMFGGSKNISDFETPLQIAGGENNAFTTNDITNYYVTVPSNQIETAFWLESDRMLELDFSQEKLDIQKSVVIEEFKQRYLNRPYGDAHHLLRKIHFQKHPYQWPTIGKNVQQIEEATLEEVKSFFYSHYAPNNAVLVVSGDVETNNAFEMAEKWFGPIPHREINHPKLAQEPVQREIRKETVFKSVPNSAVYKMYHIPAKSDPRYFAVDFITDILSAGKASRLYNNLLKNRQLVTKISAFSWGAYHPGMVSIDATLAPGVTPEEYERALENELEDLKNIQEAELKRVKNIIETHFIMQRCTMMNKALSLAMSEATGNIEMVNNALENYLKLTRNDIISAVEDYFRADNCSTLYYLSDLEKND